METVKGLDDLLQKLDNLPKELEEVVDGVVKDNAGKLQQSAQRFVPVDIGKLRQSIVLARSGKLTWKVVVLKKYGAYVEFGTGGLVKVPAKLQELAIQFKGRGVREINLPARPYLYPAFELQRDEFINDLKQLLEVKSKSV